MPLDMEVGLSPEDFVLDGDPKRGWSPQIFGPCLMWPNGSMDEVALGMEVGLGPVHIVLHGDTAPLPKQGHSPLAIFGPSLLWPNGWMHQDATWYGGRP